MMEQEYLQLLVAAGTLAVVLLAVVSIVRRKRRDLTIRQVAKHIAFDWKKDLILPDGLEGEIQIDHLMLTSKGLLVLDIKEVEGNIFGSNLMDEWTVITSNRRHTFRNPQPVIFDKVAAVRRHLPDIPVAGYILFTHQARFEKGRPQGVITLPELNELYAPAAGSDQVLNAFRPHWERLMTVAHSAV